MDMQSMAEKDALLRLQKKLRSLIAEIEEAKADGGGMDAAADPDAELGGEDASDDMDGLGGGGDLGGEDGMGDELAEAGGSAEDALAAARKSYFKTPPPRPRREGTGMAMLTVEASMPKKGMALGKGKKGVA